MKICHGNLFDHLDEYSCVLITTNGTIKKNGDLVMGAGAAKQMAKMHSTIPRLYGNAIRRAQSKKSSIAYGAILCLSFDGKMPYFGAFQVKYNWWEKADLDLIENSTNDLIDNALKYHERTFALNYPGIGNGGLTESQVEPIIERLPDNVDVWKFQ